MFRHMVERFGTVDILSTTRDCGMMLFPGFATGG
jgi:hypothetical protein